MTLKRWLHVVAASIIGGGPCLSAQAVAGPRGTIPAALSDAEFWRIFTTFSEAGGSFPSENLTSNERSFTSVIPTLIRTAPPDGVYLGVGPEQNFTYIANLRPAMALILDIRRQNALVHLMYKALFEMSPTRSDFIGHLFARTIPSSLGTTASAAALMNAALDSAPTAERIAATRDSILSLLARTHGFALPEVDRAVIGRVYAAFAIAGPHVNYGYTVGSGMPALASASYPSFAVIQTATNEDGAALTFLASEVLYQQIRDLERRNLVVPVVGDFAGDTALRAVGAYLAGQHATVTAFYTSNVEEYLLPASGQPDGQHFYGNLQALPLDGRSQFIRSARPVYTPAVGAASWPPGTEYSRTRFDSAGIRWNRVISRTATGVLIATTVDGPDVSGRGASSVTTLPYASANALTYSGLASIQSIVSAYALAGGTITYRDVMALTQFVPR